MKMETGGDLGLSILRCLWRGWLAIVAGLMRSRSSAQGVVGASWWWRDSGGGARGLLWFLVAGWGF